MFLAWRSRTLKRVVHATFAGETLSACKGLGAGALLRACDLGVWYGPAVSLTGIDPMRRPVIDISHCRKLLDTMHKALWSSLQSAASPWTSPPCAR